MPYRRAMTTATRRAALTLLAATAAAAGGAVPARPARARAAADVYLSNTHLYADRTLVAGTHYARRFRRHAHDDSAAGHPPFPHTVVLALHGGGIEPGTSELCLAVAGYHPATLVARPAAGPAYDYWMFEGLLARDNGTLHVTATHCDDPVAVSLCAGAQRAVSLHGCGPDVPGLPDNPLAVLVGGRDTALKGRLIRELTRAYEPTATTVEVVDAAGGPLAGEHPDNIVNRTLNHAGAQLEITTELRGLMFGVNTRAGRKDTTTDVFDRFVAATRAALAGS